MAIELATKLREVAHAVSAITAENYGGEPIKLFAAEDAEAITAAAMVVDQHEMLRQALANRATCTRCDSCAQAAEDILAMVPPVHVCRWEEDADGIYRTACGQSWCFTDGTAAENRAKFCIYCGGSIADVLFEESAVPE